MGQAAERQLPAPGEGGGYYPVYPGGGYYGGYYPVYYDPFYYGGYGYYGSYWGYNNCGLGYSCYSNPWGYYSPFLMPGYGYGVGYFGYDPWYDPFGGDMYGYGGYGGGGGYSSSEDADTGAVRLKVKPGHAQVFVDGYYVGTIDSFDGAFQKLTVAAGPHKIELRADGYEPEVIQVLVQPGETVAFKGDLKRIK